MKSLLVVVLLTGLPLLAAAMADERTQLAAERRSLGDRFDTEQRDCAKRFAVTACVDDTQARRRAALAPLRERELRLDEAERRQRAAERRAAIGAKLAAAASRPAEAASPTDSSAEPVVRVRAPPGAASGAVRTPGPKADEAGRAAQAAQATQAAQAEQRVREAQARQHDLQAAQQRIQRRLAQRAARGNQAEPLPVPASSPRR